MQPNKGVGGVRVTSTVTIQLISSDLKRQAERLYEIDPIEVPEDVKSDLCDIAGAYEAVADAIDSLDYDNGLVVFPDEEWATYGRLKDYIEQHKRGEVTPLNRVAWQAKCEVEEAEDREYAKKGRTEAITRYANNSEVVAKVLLNRGIDPSTANEAHQLQPISLTQLQADNPQLNPPVINGLLRKGETANVVAASKVGKSWLVYDLALSIATGSPWLDRFDTEQGRVLLIDNELHSTTLANRMPRVAKAKGIDITRVGSQIDVLALRGKGITLDQLAYHLGHIEPGRYRAIIADAWYRFIPKGLNENSNADIMGLYNLLDRYAASTGAAWIVVHHASKGQQGDKAVTDVGAGAGSQSRAADAHIVLRPHEEDDHVVLEAAVRSFAPVAPLGLRWEFPTWKPCEIDTDALKGRKTAGEERRDTADGKGMQEILEVLGAGPLTTRAIRGKTAMGRDRCQRLLDRLTVGEAVTYTEAKVRGGTAREYQAVGKRSESGPTTGLVSQSSG